MQKWVTVENSKGMYPLTCLAFLVLFAGCSAPTAGTLPFSEEQAIARASQDAKQHVPEVGIQQARIDAITAELTTLGEADRRMGGQRGPGGYGPGQTPQSPVWWVTVRGYFQYEGMAAAPNAAPICEADQRNLIYDAQTGESAGESVPNTRCAPSAVPGETATPPPAITPIAIPRTLHDEVELALGKAELPDRKMVCEWEVLGETRSELYVYFSCESAIQPGPLGTGQAVIHLSPDGAVQSVQRPRDGSLWGKDVQALFPPPVQTRIRSFNTGVLAARRATRRAQPNAIETATPVPTDAGYPFWVGTPATGQHPQSDQPLPAGIANGDIIESNNLLWFVWENTKSRIWFPNGAEFYLISFEEDPDITRRLSGVTLVPERWVVVFASTPDQKGVKQVYLADMVKHIIHPLKHQVIPWDQAKRIPTAIGDQYHPICLEN